MFSRIGSITARVSRSTLSSTLSSTPRPALSVRPATLALAHSTSAAAYSNSAAPTRACPSCGAQIPLPASPCPSCGALVRIPQGLSLHSLLSVSEPIPVCSPEGAPDAAPPTPDASTQTGSNAPARPKRRIPGHNTFDIPSELDRLPARGYELNPRDLRNRMLKRQAALHPDRQAGGDTALAAELSAQVNKAYETLASPLRRAEYILAQYGLDTAETDKLADHDMLMEILEAREELEEASLPEEIEQLRDENKAKVDALVIKITDAFKQDPPDLTEAKRSAVELKYWAGLEEAAKEKL